MAVSRKFKQLVLGFLQEYTILANWADKQGRFIFSVVPKHHWYYHLGERAQCLNLRRGNCMIDEDFVGRVKTVVRSCSWGTESHNVPSRFVEKYTWGMYLLSKHGS